MTPQLGSSFYFPFPMNKVIRVVLGIAFFLPEAYLAFFCFGWLYTLAVNFFVEGRVITTFIMTPFFGKLFIVSLVCSLALVFACMMHTLLTRRLTRDAQGIWLLIMLMGNIFIPPLYWYLNIWRDPDPSFQFPEGAKILAGRGDR